MLTESQSNPTNVNMGILLNIGSRDETTENSGSLLSIKNTYMKTVLNTNETVNNLNLGQLRYDLNGRGGISNGL